MIRWFITSGTLAATIASTCLPVHGSSPLPTTKMGHYVSNLQYTGGTGTGYTLEQIRWGDHHDFERLVLEFSTPAGEAEDALPRMKVETEYYPMRLALRLPGSDSRREEIFLSRDPFRMSKLLSGVDVFEVCGGGQHLTIVPARPVEFEVFTLPTPPRLVVDVILSRMDPLREEKKLSVRTLPLYGDQVCLFLEEAADAGVTPRLISDAAGNVFGELGLYDDPDAAFEAAERYRARLGGLFSLVVKGRGMMQVPAVLP